MTARLRPERRNGFECLCERVALVCVVPYLYEIYACNEGKQKKKKYRAERKPTRNPNPDDIGLDIDADIKCKMNTTSDFINCCQVKPIYRL